MKNLFVTTTWLAENLDRSDVRVVDIRGRVLPASEPLPHYFSHYDDYLRSHIPGAVFVDWTTDIVEPESPTYDVAEPARYAELMSRLGIDQSVQVVAYDDAGGMLAARLWWTLNYYGHTSVAVLDGGWQKWLSEKRPVDAEIPRIEPRHFEPRTNPHWRADVADIQAAGVLLLDVRSVAEFKGETSRARRSGHIPGAVNLPRKQMLTETGELLPVDELKVRLESAGLSLGGNEGSADVIVYCNSGVSASFGLMALRAVGYQTGRVYDSSWKEWGNRDDLPIATGDSKKDKDA